MFKVYYLIGNTLRAKVITANSKDAARTALNQGVVVSVYRVNEVGMIIG